jgi:hypothetical protein
MAVLGRIVDGSVSLAFRRWRRPRVRAGTRLRTAVGVVAVDAVGEVDAAAITDEDARRAGSASREELLGWLLAGGEGGVYRVALHWAGPDPRVALRRRSRLGAEERATLEARLQAMDERAAEPWTRPTLELIAASPGTRAPDLAVRMGMETAPFKARVRRLKELGLTESLAVGYRLSPRGRAVLRPSSGRAPSGPGR